MIREDRELPSLALKIMDGSATASEQWHYGQRLIAAGQRLQRWAEGTGGAVIEGDVVGENLTAPPRSTVEPADWRAGEPSEPDRHP